MKSAASKFAGEEQDGDDRDAQIDDDRDVDGERTSFSSAFGHRKTAGSLVQKVVKTRARSESSSSSSWIAGVFGLVHSQAVYWLGARATLVVCAGSLLFGLFLFDESAHHAREARLEPEQLSANDPLPLSRSLPKPATKDTSTLLDPGRAALSQTPLTDNRPGAGPLRLPAKVSSDPIADLLVQQPEQTS